MRRFGTALIAISLCGAMLAGCSPGTHSALIPTSDKAAGSNGKSMKPMDVTAGQTQNLVFNGVGSSFAQSVTYDVQFEGDISAASADKSVATVDPSSQRAVHAPGAGTKYATFTITPVAAGKTTITITDKHGGSAIIDATVNGTHAFIVGNNYMNHLEEFAAGASGTAAPAAVLQSSYTPRGVAFDPSGNFYVSTGAGVLVYAPGATSPTRFIHGTDTELNCTQGIAADSASEIFVVGCGQVTVYSGSANGDAPPIRALSIPNLGPNAALAVDAAGNLFVYDPHNGTGATISEYAAGAQGNATPIRTIAGSVTLANTPPWGAGIAVDPLGYIDVSTGNYNGATGAALTFAPDASGAADPVAVITGPNAMLYHQYLAADQNGTIWSTTSLDGVTQLLIGFARGSSGDVNPTYRFVAGGIQQNYSTPIAVDPSGNPYVADTYSAKINGYAPSSPATGAAPVRSISLGTPGMGQVNGVSLDRAGNVYVSNSWSGTIDVFSGMTNGSPSPARVIGTPANPVSAADAIVDGQGQLYASMVDSDTIKVFGASASGNATPLRTISGPDTRLSQPRQIGFDPNGNLVVVNQGSDSITVYAPTASGDAAPIRTIAGSNTLLSSPAALGVDGAGNIYVGNAYSSSTAIVVFSPDASGNATPARVLAGFNVPIGSDALAVDAAGYIYQEGGTNVFIYAPGANGNTAPFKTVTMQPTDGGFWNGIAVMP